MLGAGGEVNVLLIAGTWGGRGGELGEADTGWVAMSRAELLLAEISVKYDQRFRGCRSKF